jgi:hypothetical protein
VNQHGDQPGDYEENKKTNPRQKADGFVRFHQEFPFQISLYLGIKLLINISN